jgi:hypothetical protein
MISQLEAFASDEQGLRFLLNLYWGLRDNSMKAVAKKVCGAVEALEDTDAASTKGRRLDDVVRAIFKTPDTFQFHGPEPDKQPVRWMTVRSAEELLKRAKDGLSPTQYDDLFAGQAPEGMDGDRPEDIYADIADTLNDAAPEITFSLSQFYGKRPAPVWLSRWCEFERDCLESTSIKLRSAGTRIRDWLGLSHYGFNRPLFLIRTREPISASDLNAHRPTILDAMPPRLFKHPTSNTKNWAGCGSTADIELLAAGNGQSVDGGPEVVARQLMFCSSTHECFFLGRAGDLRYDWENAKFHSLLMPSNQQLDAVLAEIQEHLTKARLV